MDGIDFVTVPVRSAHKLKFKYTIKLKHKNSLGYAEDKLRISHSASLTSYYWA